MKNKPTVSNGFVRCLCIFRPENIDVDTWLALTNDQRDKQAEWTSYRFDINEVQEYFRAAYPNSITVSFKNGRMMTCEIDLELMDYFMDQRSLKVEQHDTA